MRVTTMARVGRAGVFAGAAMVLVASWGDSTASDALFVVAALLLPPALLAMGVEDGRGATTQFVVALLLVATLETGGLWLLAGPSGQFRGWPRGVWVAAVLLLAAPFLVAALGFARGASPSRPPRPPRY